MLVRVVRQIYTAECTLGELSLDGATHECWTLEDIVREGSKVYGATAIPAGIYECIVSYSNRFRTNLPLLIGVPGFTGVRIHAGNRANDTKGCILVGHLRSKNSIYESRKALDALLLKLPPKFRLEVVQDD